MDRYSPNFNANKKCLACDCPVPVPAWKYCVKCTTLCGKLRAKQRKKLSLISDLKIIHANQRTTARYSRRMESQLV